MVFVTILTLPIPPPASYLPRPGTDPFQFVYIDGKGELCARSAPFTFCAPKPLEDLVTLEQEGSGEDGGADLLLVVPRAELLQVMAAGEGGGGGNSSKCGVIKSTGRGFGGG